MATVNAGASATETLATRSTITISAIDGTERANVVVLRAGAQVFGDRLSNGASVGPFNSGDVVLISAEGGSIDYAIATYTDVQSSVSGGGVAATAVTGAAVLADTPPASPGTWPALSAFYVSDAAAGVDVGTQVVWIPTGHATLPAAKGWRFAFYPSATVV